MKICVIVIISLNNIIAIVENENNELHLCCFVKENYGVFAFSCRNYHRIYELMQHDKKNETGAINFTFLKSVGDIQINQTAKKTDIEEVLDFYREFFGC